MNKEVKTQERALPGLTRPRTAASKLVLMTGSPTPEPASDEVKTQERVFGPRLRRRDAALYLGLAEQTLARWFCEGTGPPAYRLSSRAVVYDKRDLDIWIAERKAASSAEAFEKAKKQERARAVVKAPASAALPRKRGRPRREPGAIEASA
jgi:predicted DNA-binding transcriptional regulator AlpA